MQGESAFKLRANIDNALFQVHDLSRPQLLEAKKLGFSDKQIAKVIQR
jgi:hypothetical protein